MFSITAARYFLYLEPTDMRKSFDELCGLVANKIGPVELLLKSIDTVILANGVAKQRYNFGSGGYNEEQWIAGVGSLNGTVNVGWYLCWIDLYADLSCCHSDDELIYQSSSYKNCFVYTVGIEAKESGAKHLVYPNPFTRHLILEFNYIPLQSYRLQMINSRSQIVIDKEDIKSRKVFVNVNQLSTWLYFYRLFNESTVIASSKLVKE